MARLFDPFFRVEGQLGRPQGNGVGLAVARGLIEANSGCIWVENRPTRGARFVFTLPVTEVAASHFPHVYATPVAKEIGTRWFDSARAGHRTWRWLSFAG